MSFIQYTQQQLSKYYERIGFEKTASVNLETLRDLQWLHLTHINYENLDILAGIPLSLEPQDLYHKFVEREVGGYCFEANGLMSNVLKSIGFRVHNYAARICRSGSMYAERPRLHRCLVVDLDDDSYLVDVGLMGEAPHYPVRIEEGVEQFDGLNEYRFVRDDFYYWLLQCRLSGSSEWQPVYGFTLEEQLDADFIPNSYYCEMHPNSTFRGRPRLSLIKADRCIILNGNELRIQRGAETDIIPLETTKDVENAMSEYFGECFRSQIDS